MKNKLDVSKEIYVLTNKYNGCGVAFLQMLCSELFTYFATFVDLLTLFSIT